MAHQEDVVHAELLDQWARLEIMVKMERLENQGCKEFQEGRDQWDLLETRDSLETRVLKGHLVCLGHKGQGVMQERTDATDVQDLRGRMAPLGTEVLLEVQGHEVSKACQDQLEKMGLQAKMVPRACRVSWV